MWGMAKYCDDNCDTTLSYFLLVLYQKWLLIPNMHDIVKISILLLTVRSCDREHMDQELLIYQTSF